MLALSSETDCTSTIVIGLLLKYVYSQLYREVVRFKVSTTELTPARLYIFWQYMQ